MIASGHWGNRRTAAADMPKTSEVRSGQHGLSR